MIQTLSGHFIDTFRRNHERCAPKVRAMQLIKLEMHNRGAYGHCIGFIGRRQPEPGYHHPYIRQPQRDVGFRQAAAL